MNNRYLVISLMAVLGLKAQAQGPRLVVNITVDQLQSEYLEWFAPAFGEDGFQKLLTEGMVFEKAAYPFEAVDRASAISSVVTGTTPFYHTITADKWIDRETLLPVVAGPEHLAVTTLGDELKIGTQGKGKVIAIATSAETARLSGGQTPNRVLWSEQKPKTKGRKNKKPQPSLNTQVTDLALQSLRQDSLGMDSIPDLLCLTYDAIGKSEATYRQLDEELARLIRETQAQTGKEQTLFVLTSTGYHDPEPVDEEKYHVPTGTFYINRAANLLNMYFGALWGHGRYVDAGFRNQIYLNHQQLENKQLRLTDALERAQAFLLQMAGVKSVKSCLYEAHQGDISIEVAPGWHIQNEDSHEDQQVQFGYHAFPIIVYGARLPAQTVETPVTIDRIAPAIAKAIRIRAPNACSSRPLF